MKIDFEIISDNADYRHTQKLIRKIYEDFHQHELNIAVKLHGVYVLESESSSDDKISLPSN